MGFCGGRGHVYVFQAPNKTFWGVMKLDFPPPKVGNTQDNEKVMKKCKTYTEAIMYNFLGTYPKEVF